MKFKDLNQSEIDLITKVYKESESRFDAQSDLSTHFNVSTRSIRNWVKKLDVIGDGSLVPQPKGKMLIYDIETSRLKAWLWWTGQQYVLPAQIDNSEPPRIITVSWKWLGEDDVKTLTWDKNHSDRQLIEEFLKEYNKADLVIGVNQDKFDNRWINARAIQYGLHVNTLVRSSDIQKEAKRLMRLPSYSLSKLCEFFDVTKKLSNEGNIMWEKIQQGTPEEQVEYMEKMIEYNVGDIISTEEVYMKMRRYMSHKTHIGVLNGEEKYTCPLCGTSDVQLDKTTVTPAGTVQRIMKCNHDEKRYKITNKQYMEFLNNKIKNKL